MTTSMIWIDVAHCTGCGECIEACPAGALTLADGLAHVDQGLCTGCQACVAACPEAAIQPVLKGEIVAGPQPRPPTIARPSPVAEAAGTAIAVAGAGLIVRLARALIDAIQRWSLSPRSTANGAQGALSGGDGERAAGRRSRHRRRGR
jgi:NAD-dependent dihydropyrimidine dehydrogenase PreA subunit